MISTATVREWTQRIGEWTRIGQGPVAHARGTERDRIGSVKGDRIKGMGDSHRYVTHVTPLGGVRQGKGNRRAGFCTPVLGAREMGRDHHS